MRRAVIAMLAVVVAGILFVVLCTFVKRPYERILLIRFGSLRDESQCVRLAYNWYLKLPTDTIVPIDTRLHLYTGPLQQVATATREPISVRTFAAWRIVDPVKFYQTTQGSDIKARDIIDQKMRGLVGGKLATFGLDQLFNTDESKVETAKVEQAVAQEATNGSPGADAKERQTGLKEQGIEIAEVGFSRMAFPPANAEAVYATMVSRLNSQALIYQAEGDKQVRALNTQAQDQAAQIVAEATAEAQKIRGEGDAAALKLIAEAQGDDPAAREFYQFWKSLEYGKNVIGKNTVLVLPTDHPWLRGIFQPNLPQVQGMQGAATRPANGAGTSGGPAPVLRLPAVPGENGARPEVQK